MSGPYIVNERGPELFIPGTQGTILMDYSTDKRKQLADSGDALPDGSYPIVTKQDLANAVLSIGRANPANPADRAKVKAHIIKRARALDAVSMLPKSWHVTT